MTKVLAVLDTMWGTQAGRPVPRIFKISRTNHSGRRLYSLISTLDNASLWVTNSCPIMVSSASEHGTPDPKFLNESLVYIQDKLCPEIILVCGKIAQATFEQAEYRRRMTPTVIEIPHPAARKTWTSAYIAEVQSLIRCKVKGEQTK
jgi:hypothetical protein